MMYRFPDHSSSHPKQGGFYLVEVMLTVIVLTVGLLALSALHIHNKQTNLVAIQRSLATQLSHDLFERMRSNGAALDVYINNSRRDLTGTSMSTPPNCQDPANPCIPDQIALYDLWEWEQYLNGALSTVEVDGSTENVGILFDPVACISGPAGAAGRYTIAIAWRSTKPVGAPPDTDNSTADECGDDLGDDRHIYWVDAYLSAS